MREIRSAAVIGAGVMGAGIAAHIANAGVPVLLLDVTRDIAASALAKLLASDPPAFMETRAAKLLTTGGIDEELAKISDRDWIVEAVVEKPEVKRALYAKMAPHLAEGAIVSSNTSTIALAELVKGASDTFRRNFLITHFFNPPRYLRLLEIVAGPETDPGAVSAIERFADLRLGKTTVRCKDRPGFIANRLGCFWMQSAIATAIEQKISVEEADAVMGRPFGIPKTGVFGLADLVGIDLMPHVNASLARALEPGDLFHAVNVPLPMVERMISEGLTGRKGKGGFYRINREQGKRKEAIDLATGEYHAAQKIRIDASAKLLTEDSRLGRYAAKVMLGTLAYAALMVGDAADDVQSIDEAMRLGYNWTWGPFELIDRIGVEEFRQLLTAAGLPIAPVLENGPFYRDGAVLKPGGTYVPLTRAEGIELLADIKRSTAPLLSNAAASLWDVGDGIACFELTSKMNTIDGATFDLLNRGIDFVAANCKAMVIYSDAANFSAGVNLMTLAAPAMMGNWKSVEDLVALGQQTNKRLKYAPFPTVAAPAGLALGGGCELLLHCAGIQAHAESYIGLVETGVGILPGWGGCGELLLRWQTLGRLPKGPMPPIAKAFEIISLATVSKSAAQAKEYLFLRPNDGITMNRARLLPEARARAVAMAKHYKPPEKTIFQLPGPSAQTALDISVQSFVALGKASAHDATVASALARVLTGGDTDITRPFAEDEMLPLERAELLLLAHNPLTAARIAHMLQTGKPLRN